MRALLLGTPDDVRGFALAGVTGLACLDAGDVERAAAAVKARDDVALVLVSQAVAKLSPQAIASLAGEPPAVVVLP